MALFEVHRTTNDWGSCSEWQVDFYCVAYKGPTNFNVANLELVKYIDAHVKTSTEFHKISSFIKINFYDNFNTQKEYKNLPQGISAAERKYVVSNRRRQPANRIEEFKIAYNRKHHDAEKCYSSAVNMADHTLVPGRVYEQKQERERLRRRRVFLFFFFSAATPSKRAKQEPNGITFCQVGRLRWPQKV